MFRRKYFYTCIVFFDSGEEKSFSNIQDIEPFMSFVDSWYIDWETVNVISQATREVVQTFSVQEYVNAGAYFNPDHYINPNSQESWL